MRVWTRIALLSFGGPAGQIAVMHRILVEEERWVGEARFLHALSFCTLLPGPEAQQLATYLGWLMHRTAGGLLAGGLFVLPGLLAILGLSILYVSLGQVPAVSGLFFGLKCAVLAVVVQALLRVSRRALRGRPEQVIAALAFLALFVFAAPFPPVVLAAGIAGWLATRTGLTRFGWGRHAADTQAGLPEAQSRLGTGTPPHARPGHSGTLPIALAFLVAWLAPVVLTLLIFGYGSVYFAITMLFAKLATVTFGGAYAVLAYVAQEAVEVRGWLAPGEMLDGLGMAETTPGPLIMVVQFVAFLGAYRAPGPLDPLVAGTLGGLLATWVTFAPSFLWIFTAGPYVEALHGNAALSGALDAITAAVVGVILNLALWFSIHVLFRRVVAWRPGLGIALDLPDLSSLDVAALVLSVAAAITLLRAGAGVIPVLAMSALAGVGLSLIDWH